LANTSALHIAVANLPKRDLAPIHAGSSDAAHVWASGLKLEMKYSSPRHRFVSIPTNATDRARGRPRRGPL